MPTKEQVLSIAHGIPVPNLISSIKRGIITLDELRRIKLAPEKLEIIEQRLKAEEQQLWNKACQTGDAVDFFSYLTTYPNGVFSEACRQSLLSGEEHFWNSVVANGSIPILKQYLEFYEPLNGLHVFECQEMLNDPDWVEVKKAPSLVSIDAYAQSHPGKHTIEIAELRERVSDELDWEKALQAGTIDAYREYITAHPHGRNAALAQESLENADWKVAMSKGDTAAFQEYINAHPQGRYVHEAQERIDAAAGHDEFVAEMAEDNKNADEIQAAVAGNVITWDDVIRIYGIERTQAIKDFKETVIVPNPVIPNELSKDSTEIYFWGTPSSGKTCALGSILSGAMNNYSLEAQQCQGFHYMTQLYNVFRNHSNKLCSLPPSTMVNVIQEMLFTIVDEKNKLHRATLIDIAGEIFRSIFFHMNNMFLDEQHKNTLTSVMRFLSDNSNPKIHFFVVEYGAEEVQWEGLYMDNYLSACSLYIKDNKILKNSTGVYILVTKCDKMKCPDEMIVDRAEEYVKNNLNAFYRNLEMACEKEGIKDFKVIPFSIGEVFAGKICSYDDSFIDDVIDVILAKTPELRKNNFLRM